MKATKSALNTTLGTRVAEFFNVVADIRSVAVAEEGVSCKLGNHMLARWAVEGRKFGALVHELRWRQLGAYVPCASRPKARSRLPTGM